MPPPASAVPPTYGRGDLVRCACGNPFVAVSPDAGCHRCGGRDVRPFAKPPPPALFRL